MKLRISVVARTSIWIALALAAGAATGVVSARRSAANDAAPADARFSAMR
jgi:hypothetical protein